MIKCKICEKEFKTITGLGKHLKSHKITSEEYYLKYLNGVPNICPTCGNKTNFSSLKNGYYICCSRKCSQNSEHVKAKKEEINIKNYGSPYFISSEIGREKIKQSFINKYGKDNPMKIEKFKENHKISIKKAYGVSNVSQNKTIMDKIQLGRKQCFYNKLVEGKRLNYMSTPEFELDEFDTVLHEQYYSWKCNTCGKSFKDSINNGEIPKCTHCFPRYGERSSKYEFEIIEFLKELGLKDEEIIHGDITLISPKQLDIYIPSHKLAIEFDGLYWHSENGPNKIGQFYHLQKTEQCEEKGIQLLHIFEDEWLNKPKIVKSMIRSKLGLSKERIYARKCELVQIPFKDARLFFNDNHIQGCGTPSKLCFGLMYNMSLVAVASFSVPRYSKKYEYELVRYATKRNTSVVGGFSKLLKHFIRKHSPKTIVSYADRRYSTGNVYNQCNFKELEISKPNYFYIEEDMTRSSRVKYQKHKLSEVLQIFDPNLTEWQNMQLNNYDRIWDCGNLVFLYESE